MSYQFFRDKLNFSVNKELLGLKLISQEAWSYSFYQNGEQYFLSVLCGTVAMYEITIELTAEEIVKITEGSVSSLAKEIRNSPQSYNDRRINGFEHPK